VGRIALESGWFANLPESLGALASLLETAWSVVNPPLDDGDPYARINVIEGLGFGGSFFNPCAIVSWLEIRELATFA